MAVQLVNVTIPVKDFSAAPPNSALLLEMRTVLGSSAPHLHSVRTTGFSATPQRGNFLSKLTVIFYEIRRFITLSSARRIQFTSLNPISMPYSLVLSSHLCLYLQGDMRPSGFPTEVLYSFLNSPIHIITPIHLTPFHFIILMTFGGENKV